MNIWFWPFAIGNLEQYWSPGISPAETIKRYALFYLATSFWWDAVRALGNIGLTLALGRPTLRILRRFQQRFTFEYRPVCLSARSREAGQASDQTGWASADRLAYTYQDSPEWGTQPIEASAVSAPNRLDAPRNWS
jgi:hypothetical protein